VIALSELLGAFHETENLDIIFFVFHVRQFENISFFLKLSTDKELLSLHTTA